MGNRHPAAAAVSTFWLPNGGACAALEPPFQWRGLGWPTDRHGDAAVPTAPAPGTSPAAAASWCRPVNAVHQVFIGFRGRGAIAGEQAIACVPHTPVRHHVIPANQVRLFDAQDARKRWRWCAVDNRPRQDFGAHVAGWTHAQQGFQPANHDASPFALAMFSIALHASWNPIQALSVSLSM